LICWKCSKKIDDIGPKVGFRAVCPHCDIDLHTCTNCKYYSPGKPNDCMVPGTEYIRDREASNLCEDFKPNLNPSSASSKKEKFKSLFKDED